MVQAASIFLSSTLLLAFLASGCTSPAADSTASAPETSAMPDLPIITLSPANVTTDTLHFLEPPGLGLTIANHTVLTPKAATFQAQSFAWNMTLASPAVLSAADFDLWLRLTATQAQAGGEDPGCTAVALLTITINATATNYAGGCGSLGIGLVPPGDHELRFAAPPGTFATPLVMRPGDEIRLTVTLYLENPGFGVTCYILGGAGFDSAVHLTGLSETVPFLPQGVGS